VLGVSTISLSQGFQKSGDGQMKSGASGLRSLSLTDIITSDYLRDSTYIYHRQSEDSISWKLRQRKVYAYDNQGREVERIHSEKRDGLWFQHERLLNTYSSSHFLLSQYQQEKVDSAWFSAIRRDYSYNYIGLEKEIVEFIQVETGWVRDFKSEYDYDSDQNVSKETSFNWGVEAKRWMPESRIVYEYSSEDLLKIEILQLWMDSLKLWMNHTSRQYDYNSNNQLLSTIRNNWDQTGEKWISTSILSLNYNEDGKISGSEQHVLGSEEPQEVESQNTQYDAEGNLGQVVHSNWNSEEETWESYKKEVNFWSQEYTGNLDPNKNEIDCTFKNPYYAGLPWYCESLKDDVIYRVSVVDIQGRVTQEKAFTGGTSFRLDNPLEPGYYTVLITGGLDYHTEKILVKD
jgi:hypothetical protein